MSGGEIVGTVGVSFLLVAFAFNMTGRLTSTSKLYLGLNILGAALATVSSYIIGFWPFVVLEGVWTLASVWMLFKSPANE